MEKRSLREIAIRMDVETYVNVTQIVVDRNQECLMVEFLPLIILN